MKAIRDYELMAILKPDLDTEALNKSISKVEGLIKKQGGTPKSINRLGRKKLAYEIKKEKEGIYNLFYFQAEPESIKEIGRVLKLDEDILRFLIVKQPEKVK